MSPIGRRRRCEQGRAVYGALPLLFLLFWAMPTFNVVYCLSLFLLLFLGASPLLGHGARLERRNQTPSHHGHVVRKPVLVGVKSKQTNLGRKEDPEEDAKESGEEGEEEKEEISDSELLGDGKWPTNGHYESYKREGVVGGKYDNRTKTEIRRSEADDIPVMKDFLHDRPAKKPEKKKAESTFQGNPWLIGGIALLIALVIALVRIYAM